MRKNSPRKWLHATLDLLPVVLIPVFMIYSHRHNVAEDVPVADFQYKYESNEVNSVNDLIENNIYKFNFQSYSIEDLFINSNGNLNLQLIDDIELRTYPNFDDHDLTFLQTIPSKTLIQIESYYPGDTLYGFIRFYSNKDDLDEGNYYLSIEYLSTFTNNFNAIFIQASDFDYRLCEYTDYNDIENVAIDYTDNVMDVFLSDFNFTIEKYFNFSNVFNLNDVYGWVVTNIFNGSAPLILYSVWNIIAYEFIMDLLFLLYGLFMFFIDTCTNLMDRFYGNLSGRR